MGKFGGFYKGEKKKQKAKTSKGLGSPSTAPVFSLPKLIEKKKDKYR